MDGLRAPSPDFFHPGGEKSGPVASVAIGAHHDDLEFMALSPIMSARRDPECRFAGIVCTDGKGSALGGAYAALTPAELAEARMEEQRRAALEGGYAGLVQLGYPSSALRELAGRQDLAADLAQLLKMFRPETLYIHNPLDKHPTHLAVSSASLAAARSLPPADRPRRLLACEGWRGLDWVGDREKQVLDAGSDTDFAERLFGIFQTQIGSGKRYDRAVLGRKFANATFLNPHALDKTQMAELALDLTPLLAPDPPDTISFCLGFIDRFREEAESSLRTYF